MRHLVGLNPTLGVGFERVKSVLGVRIWSGQKTIRNGHLIGLNDNSGLTFERLKLPSGGRFERVKSVLLIRI